MKTYKWSDIKNRGRVPTPEEQEAARQRVITELKRLNDEYPNEGYANVLKELEQKP